MSEDNKEGSASKEDPSRKKKLEAKQEEVESAKKQKTSTASEGNVRPSIKVKLIRHAESANNAVYRDARYIFRGGTPEFDEAGWWQYVDKHRSADPHISKLGEQQSQALANYLVPHLANQASQPVHIVTSPMLRTLETIRPTLQGLAQAHKPAAVLVNAFYHESEGCHIKNVPQEGMNPAQIKDVLMKTGEKSCDGKESENQPEPYASLDFTGFPKDESKGWYHGAEGEESRAASEERAAKFFMWLCEYLDEQLQQPTNTTPKAANGTSGHHHHDVFDAGVSIPGEEEEDEHDKMAQRKRKRRTCLLIGHGDFMSLVLKRVISGFGHYVEQAGTPHRSAFVHFNTGMTELEYFGKGRFLVMGQNHTPHIADSEHSTLRSGGSLKDGWSYIIPSEHLNSEVKVAFGDDELDEHVREQTQALKALYLKSGSAAIPTTGDASPQLQVEEQKDASGNQGRAVKHFVVHRGLQVVGCATYSDDTGLLTDVAIRPSAGSGVMESLMQAVRQHTRKQGRSSSLLVYPRAGESQTLFKALGFAEVEGETEEHIKMELKH